MRSSRHAGPALAALAVLALAATASPARADTTVYVAGGGGQFGTLDLATGAYTAIGSGLGETPIGLGFGPGGTLYGVEGHGNDMFLGPAGTAVYQISTATGAETLSGNAPGQQSYTATSDGGTFYDLTIDMDASFFTVDPATATEAPLNPSTGVNADGLLGVIGGDAYVAAISPNFSPDDFLYRIDTATGAATLVGDTGTAADFDFFSGVYAGGSLYGFGSDGGIYTFNTTSGAATQVASYDIGDEDYISAAAAQPSPAPEVPEAGVLALLGLGLGGLILRAKKRQAAA